MITLTVIGVLMYFYFAWMYIMNDKGRTYFFKDLYRFIFFIARLILITTLIISFSYLIIKYIR